MKTTILYRFNINIALKILLLLGFTIFFLYTIFTGSVSLYVHPRIIPYMIFASIVMTVIAFLQLGNLFKLSKKKINSWPLLFFIIPLILAFVLPAKSFNSSTGTVGNVQLSGGENKTNNTVEPSQESGPTDNLTGNNSGNSVSGSKNTTTSDTSNKGLQLQNGILVMNDSNFYECMNEIYTDMDKYDGVQIEVVGFVFNDNEGFSDNEFVPARMMMTCCAADMVPVGFLCRYGKASELKADAWVKVTGTIGKTQFDGETVPYIKAESVEKAEKPDVEYVYPY